MKLPVMPPPLALLAASSLLVATAATMSPQESLLLDSPSTIDGDIEASIIESLHELVYDANIANLLPQEQQSSSNADTKFDLYVLAQSWQPEFCRGKEKLYPGCKQPQAFWKTHFTLHGLWPERESGAPPGFCQGEPFDAEKVESEIGFAALTEYWPDVKFSSSSPEYPDFWKHEWTRHGTCSGLSQIEYFSQAVNLVRNGTADTPAIVQENVGKSVPIEKLREAFGGSSLPATLKCMHGGDTLSQVFTCWLKDEKNLPIRRRPCPEHVLREDTCSRSSIQIPAFSG